MALPFKRGALPEALSGARPNREKHVYLMEAFDQPLEGTLEGAVGAYWGVCERGRSAEFAFIEPIVRIRLASPGGDVPWVWPRCCSVLLHQQPVTGCAPAAVSGRHRVCHCHRGRVDRLRAIRSSTSRATSVVVGSRR